MKPVDVTKSVMQKVVVFEKKRSLRFAGAFLFTIVIFVLLLLVSIFFFAQSIIESEVADLFSFYFQDWDAIQALWHDAVEFMWDVIPHWVFFLAGGAVICFILIFFLSRKKRSVILRRIRSIKKYEEPKSS